MGYFCTWDIFAHGVFLHPASLTPHYPKPRRTETKIDRFPDGDDGDDDDDGDGEDDDDQGSVDCVDGDDDDGVDDDDVGDNDFGVDNVSFAWWNSIVQL